MTRDGLIEVNETKETAERVSRREQEADFSKPQEQPAPQAGQEAAAQNVAELPPVSPDASPLPLAPELPHRQDTATAERVMERVSAAQTRKASKKAAQKAQRDATVKEKSSRLQFTEEELNTPELETYIKKSDKAADRLDAAKAAIPKEKKLVGERTFDEATGKAKTRLRFTEQEKPINGGKAHPNPLSRPAQEAGIFVHNKIHSVEKDNSGVEGAHKSEELAEKGAKYGTRKIREGYRSHKLKPYRAAAKAEKAAEKANVNYLYHKTLHENPQLTSNPLSRFMQRQQIKRQYRHLSTRKEVRTWNLIAWNFRSNVSFKVSVNGCCTTKPATPTRKSGVAEQRKCRFPTLPCMRNDSFIRLISIFKTKKPSRAISRQERKSRRSCCLKQSALCRKKKGKLSCCTISRA